MLEHNVRWVIEWKLNMVDRSVFLVVLDLYVTLLGWCRGTPLTFHLLFPRFEPSWRRKTGVRLDDKGGPVSYILPHVKDPWQMKIEKSSVAVRADLQRTHPSCSPPPATPTPQKKNPEKKVPADVFHFTLFLTKQSLFVPPRSPAKPAMPRTVEAYVNS